MKESGTAAFDCIRGGQMNKHEHSIKEIADFMTKFEEEKTTYEQQIKDHQEMIAGLLEHMQKNLARQHKLPSQMQVDEMKKDLNFKQKQLENAESTAAKLAVEVEQR